GRSRSFRGVVLSFRLDSHRPEPRTYRDSQIRDDSIFSVGEYISD
ncbi:1406_t:CDS:1, partial [Gigaspora rosea]